MRIVHTLGSTGILTHNPERFGLAGIGNSALGISVAQLTRGHAVAVFGFSDPMPQGRGAWRGVPIRTLSRWKWARVNEQTDASTFLPMVVQLAREPTPDVVHVHEFGLLRLPRGQIRTLHLHMHLGSEICSSPLWSRADGVICCSHYLRDWFLSTCNYPSERTFVVHNGASQNTAASDEEIASLRRNLGAEPCDVLVLFAGAVVPDKGLDVLFGALEYMLRDSYVSLSRLRLVVMGNRSLWRGGETSAEAKVYESEMYARGKRIGASFLGSLPHPEAQRVFAACDVVAVPSVVQEVHPLVVCEAMAAGKPIVASRVGGIPETVLEGENAILFPAGESMALANALKRIVDDDDLRKRMSSSSLHRSRLFTWDAAAQELDEIYRVLLEMKRPKR